MTTTNTEQFASIAVVASPLVANILRIALVATMWLCLFRVTISRAGLFRMHKTMYASGGTPRRRSPPDFVRSCSRRRSMSSVSWSMSTSDTRSEDEDETATEQKHPRTKKGQRILKKPNPSLPQGRLVARIMPRAFVEYKQRKLESQMDPNELIQSQQKNDGSSVSLTNPQYEYACRVIGTGRQDARLSAAGIEQIVSIDIQVDFEQSSELDDDDTADGPRSVENLLDSVHLGHIDLHMNRKAQEPADRTLTRLGISMARRILREGNNIMLHQGRQLGRREKQSIRLASKMAFAGTSESVLMVPTNSSMNADENETDGDGLPAPASKDGYSNLDVTKMTSETLWKDIAQKVDNDNVGDVHDESNGALLSLSVPGIPNPIPLKIVSCPPTILSVKTFDCFASQLFVGVPLVIQTEILHATHAEISWFANGVQVCHDSPCFIPPQDLVGKQLSVLIIPKSSDHDGHGYEEAYQFKNAVKPLPFMPLMSPLRDEWLVRSKDSLDNELRVMTYNLLADLYTSREVDQKLMYNHCHPRFLLKGRRMPMLVYEILSYRADIVCLQEVDASVYHSLLEPVFASQGYQGYYSNKASSQLEGCAMFWSLECFEKAPQQDQKTFCLRDLFVGTDETKVNQGSSTQQSPSSKHHHKYTKWDSMDSIDTLLYHHDELRRVTREKVGQVLQIATLTPRDRGSSLKKPKKMVVGNTHLFYHPMADHVRAMQAYVVCKQMDAVRRRHNNADGQDEPPYPIVLCGDMNANPLSGALQVLLQRRLNSDHFDTWKHLHDYNWEMGDYDFMVQHGYVGNDAVEDDEDSIEPVYKQQAFQDAVEYLSSDEDELRDDLACGNDDKTDSNDQAAPVIAPPHLVLPSCFPNLISGYPDMPKFTNYAVDFEETLDYILASEPDFACKRSAVMPTVPHIKEYAVAMPNEFMPSDHVSLVCDLEFKAKGNGAKMNGDAANHVSVQDVPHTKKDTAWHTAQ